MNIRLQLSEMFNTLREEQGKTYSQISSEGNLTNTQISSISKGRKGISIDKIVEVMEVVFDVKIVISCYD